MSNCNCIWIMGHGSLAGHYVPVAVHPCLLKNKQEGLFIRKMHAHMLLHIFWVWWDVTIVLKHDFLTLGNMEVCSCCGHSYSCVEILRGLQVLSIKALRVPQEIFSAVISFMYWLYFGSISCVFRHFSPHLPSILILY